MDFGKITLQQISKALDNNLQAAKKLEVNIAWGFTKEKKIYARIYNSQKTVYYKEYEGKDVHIRLAEIQSDFTDHLRKMTHAKERADMMKRIQLNKERQEMEEKRWHGS